MHGLTQPKATAPGEPINQVFFEIRGLTALESTHSLQVVCVL